MSLNHDTLQKVFALRRALELSIATGTAPQLADIKRWLDVLEDIYTVLDVLSNRLSMVYCAEDLGLALSTLIQQWQTQNPEVNVLITMKGQLSHTNHSIDRVIIHTIYELLRLNAEVYAIKALKVCLTVQHQHSRLIIRVDTSATRSSQCLTAESKDNEFTYIKTVFPILTGGLCISQHNEFSHEWWVEWDT